MIGRFVVMILVVTSLSASAQQRPDPAGPGTIIGFVIDQLGRPLPGADVYIVELKVHKTVDADGRFRFDSVPDGKFTVAARRVGYYTASRALTMVPEGVVASFRLGQIVRVLPTVVAAAARGGLSGIVADTGNKVLEGAKVEIVGSSRRDQTDTAGYFTIRVPTGRHIIRVSREGFATKIVSVTVPSDSGRRIMVWLSPSTGAERRMDANIELMRERLIRRNPVWSAIITREDIIRSGMTEMTQLAQKGAQHVMNDTCSVRVDGGPSRLPLWALKAEDIETIEVYMRKQGRYVSNGRNDPDFRQVRTDCETIYVWLRK